MLTHIQQTGNVDSLHTHTQYQGMQVLAFLTFLNFPTPLPNVHENDTHCIKLTASGRKPHPLTANQLESTVKVSNRRTLY